MVTELIDYDSARLMRKELSEYAAAHMNLSRNAQMVFGNVYLKNLENGKPETIPERMAAIAVDVASAEMRYLPESISYGERVGVVRERAKRNLEMHVSNQFRANTPTNINMGRWVAKYDESGNISGYKQSTQLGSACFVIPIEDTFGSNVAQLEDGILEAWVVQQLVHKGGGGTGFSFQRLRPKGSIIGYSPSVDGMKSISWDGKRGVASGYESFLNDFFNQATEAVKQGNSRRGANMGIQRIDHMDFLDHLYAKFGDKERTERRMKNFNLSLAVTDEFMEAAERDETYTLINPQRARPETKRVLQEKWGVQNPEVVRREDLATRNQFESILAKNKKNLFSPLTTPNMYLDTDNTTVINAYNGEAIGVIVDGVVRIRAKKVLDIFAKNAHSNGEPGIFFVDRANEYNPIFADQEYEATNPCGEQPLPPYGACNLGSINAGQFVKHLVFNSRKEMTLDDKILKEDWTNIEERKDGKVGVTYVDWDDLRSTIRDGTRFLDNVIERSDFPAEKIKQAVSNGRNIGIGYMGVHDAMILLKMRYGSKRSLDFAERLAKELHDESLVESQRMAEERGEFPLWERSLHNPESALFAWYEGKGKTIKDRFKGERKLSDKVDRARVISYGKGKIRNSCRMTQAPTGTIRRVVGSTENTLGLENLAISSGIEPVYSLIEGSNILNTNIEDFSYATATLLQREGLPVKEIADAIRMNKGSVFIYGNTPAEAAKVLEKIPQDVREVLVTASGGEKDFYEIKPEEHVAMSATFQRYNDSAISKTINLPSSATPEDIRQAYVSLWQKGAKGGTVYRDMSREFQILNVVTSGLEGKVNGKGKKTRRPLLQWSITVELPYMASSQSENVGDVDYNPERCFTTLTFNAINGHLTGVFQNIPETDPERTSLLIRANIELSGRLKEGRKLEEVIVDLEKTRLSGTRGILVDEAVMGESKEPLRYQIEGSTTSGDLLNTLYIARFLTDDGKDFDPETINEKMKVYQSGEISLRSVINTKGKVKIGEGNDAMPSILGGKKVVTVPEGTSGKLCPECG